MKKLSERMRMGREAAPWVIDAVEELEVELQRLRDQTCLCRFDKASGEGEAGTVPFVECEYHKRLRGEE